MIGTWYRVLRVSCIVHATARSGTGNRYACAAMTDDIFICRVTYLIDISESYVILLSSHISAEHGNAHKSESVRRFFHRIQCCEV